MASVDDEIIKLFLYKNSVSFNYISKKVGIPSNKLSYRVHKIIDKNIIEKVGDRYILSESSKRLFPYFDSLIDKKKYPLVVVKLHIKDNDKHLLVYRKKEPFAGFWELPTTKLQLGEPLENAAQRAIKELDVSPKFKIIKINQIRELIYSKNKILFDYFLHFFELKLDGKIMKNKEFFSKEEIKTLRIIPTDHLYLHGRIEKDKIIKLNYEDQEFTIL